MDLQSNKFYTIKELPGIIKSIGEIKFSRKKKKRKYMELSCAFDIETSSWYENGHKRACMYVWQFGIDGYCFIGRTWKEFIDFYNCLIELLAVTPEYCLIVYVHNLAYEFQFIRKWFKWEKVFAIKSRTPVYARTCEGVEFRCSYILSGYSLAKLAEQLHTHTIKKLVGDLDYRLIRHSKTQLTDAEKAYCMNDILIVMAYIDERMHADKSISNIPLTKTGYVRRYCKNACFYDPDIPRKKSYKHFRYHEMISSLTIEKDEYTELKEAFEGGFTHAGAFYSGVVVNDVTSYDFTSSYPYVMVSEQFPMSKGKHVRITSIEEFETYLKYYACMFRADFYGIKDTFIYDHYISASKCRGIQNAVKDNGRIVSADHIQITLTEKDFEVIRKTYKWESLTVSGFWVYHKAYLPTDFIKAILKLYADKTQLKNVAGKEAEYQSAKEMANSAYGMAVMDVVQEENEYENDAWKPTCIPDLQACINSYNSSYGRFLFYPWGVWVTAYARYNLWTGIYNLAEDYVYADTDSIKGINMHEHMDYIENYNKIVRIKLEHACRYHNIDISETEPQTIKGIKKPLGVYDYDGHYARFKTLGAKRYMVEDGETGEINITVSGLNKARTVPFICEGWNISTDDEISQNDPFSRFCDELFVPGEFTGKMTHTYIDDEIKGYVTDYRGKRARYHEHSCIHMENADYSLSISEEYLSFLQDRREID